MTLKSVRVQNFRSIKDATLDCGDTTVLIGANGSGKSSFLHAIEAFQNKVVGLGAGDFHGAPSDTPKEYEPGDIAISVTFGDIPEGIADQFKRYLRGGTITVERLFRWKVDKYTSTLYGILHVKKEFVDAFKSSTTELKIKYKILREQYQDLPDVSKAEEMKNAIIDYHLGDGDAVVYVHDDGNILKFTGDSLNLNQLMNFVHVQAVHDAADDVKYNKGSPLTQLMNEVVLKQLDGDKRIEDFKKMVSDKHANVAKPIMDGVLRSLGEGLSDNLKELVPSGRITLDWKPYDEFVKTPDADAKLVEDGYESAVERAGDGIQRAFVIAILRQLHAPLPGGPSRGDATAASDSKRPTMVLAIDEPELYQHPIRQRSFANLLQSLAGRGIQVLYSTHSPHFVKIDKIEQIWRLRKEAPENGGPRATVLRHTNTSCMNNRIKMVRPSHKSQDSQAALYSLDRMMASHISEGFFSDTVVLVEGEEDYAYITETAKRAGHDLVAEGIPVIPCGGKCSLSKPAAIFLNLGIKVYLIWDKDDDRGDFSRSLARLMEPNSLGDTKLISRRYACMEPNMEEVLKKDLGKEFFETCKEACKKEAVGRRGPPKPLIAYTLVNSAVDDNGKNKVSLTLSTVIDQIIALHTIDIDHGQ